MQLFPLTVIGPTVSVIATHQAQPGRRRREASTGGKGQGGEGCLVMLRGLRSRGRRWLVLRFSGSVMLVSSAGWRHARGQVPAGPGHLRTRPALRVHDESSGLNIWPSSGPLDASASPNLAAVFCAGSARTRRMSRLSLPAPLASRSPDFRAVSATATPHQSSGRPRLSAARRARTSGEARVMSARFRSSSRRAAPAALDPPPSSSSWPGSPRRISGLKSR